MLRLVARAKINWSLDILDKRSDGYHRMDMLMESVSLADELTISPAETLMLAVRGTAVPEGDGNLIMKAARALQAATGCAKGARIALVKRIPTGAGMGGGSADAAAALAGLNRLWNSGLTVPELRAIGLAAGADVPFMLTGGIARVGGIGETILPLESPAMVPLVVVQPCQPLSTREVFAAYDALGTVRHPDTARAKAALLGRDFASLAEAAGNVLAPVSEAARPQIAEAVAALHALGAPFACMTGSGSAVFGVFGSRAEALAVYRLLKKRWRRCWVCETAEEGVSFACNS